MVDEQLLAGFGLVQGQLKLEGPWSAHIFVQALLMGPCSIPDPWGGAALKSCRLHWGPAPLQAAMKVCLIRRSACDSWPKDGISSSDCVVASGRKRYQHLCP